MFIQSLEEGSVSAVIPLASLKKTCLRGNEERVCVTASVPTALCSLEKDSSACSSVLLLGMDWMCWVWDCGVEKGNLESNASGLFIFLGPEISRLSLFCFSRTITLLHKKVDLSRKGARATGRKCTRTREARAEER